MHGGQCSTCLMSFNFRHRSQDRFDMVAFWKDVATKVIHSLRMMFAAHYIVHRRHTILVHRG